MRPYRILSNNAVKPRFKYWISSTSDNPHRVHFLRQGEKIPDGCFPLDNEFSGKKDQTFVQSSESGKNILIGLGDTPTIKEIRSATHTAINTLSTLQISHADLIVPQEFPPDVTNILTPITQVGLLSSYTFDKHKSQSEEEPKKQDIEALTLVQEEGVSTDNIAAVVQGETIGTATNYARELGNIRADVGTPEFYAEEIKLCVNSCDRLELVDDIVGVDALQQEKLNLLSAVGQGATVPPRLLVVKYTGDPYTEDATALVGKGVTYDTGGLHVKPFGSMEDMHMDMCGAATCMGIMWAVTKLAPQCNLIFTFVLAENAIGANSYKPGSIIKSRKGLTVEVMNTDAEGRLCLVDGMTYVQDKYKPTTMIDFATLTGACLMALGEYYSGLFTPCDSLANQLLAAGKSADEQAWRLPVGEEYGDELKGTHSDLVNISSGRKAGASTAAAFLQKFVEKDVIWAHFDIAGAGMYSKDRGYKRKGATGYGVALILDWLQGNGHWGSN